MGGIHDFKAGTAARSADAASSGRELAPGKRTLVETSYPGVVQRKETNAPSSANVHEAAARGTAGSGEALPHASTIQRLFGRHDVSGVRAHTSNDAQQASRDIGAKAFATGNRVAFDGAPDLHTAAHEAAHVVQQRAGVHLKDGVGQANDAYERHADAVADRVVAGQSAEALLDTTAGGATSAATAVQRKEVDTKRASRANKLDAPGPRDKLGAMAGRLPEKSKGCRLIPVCQSRRAPRFLSLVL